MAKGKQKSPKDYIRLACELHLDATLDDGAAEVTSFLEGETRLFVWVDEDDKAVASTDALATNHLGAIAFVHAPGESLQCMTLAPRTYPEEEKKEMEEQDEGADSKSKNDATGTLDALQNYTRHCFGPAIHALTSTSEEEEKSSKLMQGLEDKIRELDVALGQVRRSALSQIPSVSLPTDPFLAAKAQAAVENKIPLTNLEALELMDKLQDDDFLNQIQAGVSQWIVQIRKVTVLPTTTAFPSVDSSSSSADLEEVSFWLQLEVALQQIPQELARPDVELTLNVLKGAKRFLATIALDNNTGLEGATSQTNDIAHFLRNYPAPALEAARDWDKISIAVNQIFDHIPKVRSSRYYDLERCAKLLEATTLTLRRRMVAVLETSSFLFVEFSEYENNVRFPSQDVLVQFDDRFDQFTEFFLEQGRRRKPASGKTGSEVLKELKLYHKPLQERLDMLHEFRVNHEKLQSVLKEVLGDGEVLTQVEAAPRSLLASLNVLDLSQGGTKALETALEEYDRKMDSLEAKLAKLLRDKLTDCKDAEDMFRVFARFNPLLTRTRVQAAVKEFQIQLISTVSQAVEKLQSKFTQKYEASSAAKISRLRGIPPVAGKILWAKQMERQVHALMQRMGDVLGPNWGQQLEGRQLRRSGDELLSKLDARAFFRSWVTEWEKELTNATSARTQSYPIIIAPEGREGKLVAKVNFDEKNELLFREIRQLKWLGFDKDIPRTLTLVSEESVTRYPHAVAVKTALRSYAAVRVLITPELEPLVMPQLLAIRECISEGFDVKLSTSTAVSKKRRVRFDTRELPAWVANLTDLVTKFEERVEQLLRACDKVDIALDLLERVDYDTGRFNGILQSIQKSIDKMSLSGYADLDSWVKIVDERMGEVLSKRLEDALKAWNHKFKSEAKKTEGDEEEAEESKELEVTAALPKINVPSIPVEIMLRNQEISAVPAVPSVRSQLLRCLHDFIGVVCSLQRPKSGRFEVFDSRTGHSTGEQNDEQFADLIHKVDVELVVAAYRSLEFHIREMTGFVNQWFAYQTLWDTRVSEVAAQAGEDIDKWQALLAEASEARATLDSVATIAHFGPVSVKYNKVQSQINLKYDSWQKELQSSFATILARHISQTHQRITDAKNKLEQVSLDTSSNTGDIVLGVTFIQEMKQTLGPWAKEVQKLVACEVTLKRQRHLFHSDWTETSVVQGQYENLEQILDKRNRAMEQQIPLLQARIVAEDKSSTKRVTDVASGWEQDKPLRGNMSPAKAMEVLTKFEFTMKKAKLDHENLIKAKDALGLEQVVEGSPISEALSELTDLKEVWGAMLKPYETLEEIKEVVFASAVMRKVRRSLDDLLAEMRSLSNRVRQYDAYTHLHDTIKGYVAGHGMLSDLKTEALKERHWKTILQRLGIHVAFSELTIGLLWEHGVLARKKEMQEILTVAQGEMALEVFLGDVRDRWMKQELELVLYQNRVRLIRGWDELFATLDDHMGGLVLMRSSPYYRSVREFQEEGKLWEDRLTKLRTAFDSWVDVQRRWVYLEGILFGSSDIKAQLPAEWSRFKSVDSEFIQLMRRIANRPFAMEALNIENLQRTLERLGNLMSVIQRALGEYLEKQRSDFSRFYFLGDDDLLEIIGNSQEPGKVLGHVAKMFAGIASARSDNTDLPEDTLTRFDAMISKDGEVVPFHKNIVVKKNMGVKDWLKELEERMHSTLALLLEQAVSEDKSSEVSTASDEGKKSFVEWAKKFPAQIMILATLINWSMSVDKALRSDGNSGEELKTILLSLEGKLDIMAETVLLDLPTDARKKFEQLITELVHQRDVTRSLIDEGVNDVSDFRWLYHMRYTYNPSAEKLTEKLNISLSNANFHYGFEYLGTGERLVQTPLVDKCWLTLTQALHFRMGGNPFGPAGTGKTESVKALGAQLGRFVLVMNCDETFDFNAMGRLFCGLCQVGAWGCFDEFNRLEERILSAVSQQILTIQRGLLERKSNIELVGRNIRLQDNVGVFVTMNPGYAGRSNLPDNLKSLFRSVAMVVPDRKLIAQVMLYSQGIVTAEGLSGKVVELFQKCEARMSKQSHYDFGLRALKTLLVSAGGLKRQAMEGFEMVEGEKLAEIEEDVLIRGSCNNVLPKLVKEDLDIFTEVLKETFPGSQLVKMEDEKLRTQIVEICRERDFMPEETFLQKILQLNEVIDMRHGVMCVGPVGSGKSSATKILLKAMEKVDGRKGELYVIDPKAMNKEALYGSLDGTTMEWTDGVFTSILRTVLNNQKGESDRRHWIVFDGDVDPEWAENLNSVLDDNKLLTLPSGERLGIPSNFRIILEVDSLVHATPATVSRCGMVWFSEDTVTTDMCLENLMGKLAKADFLGDRSTAEEAPSAQMLFIEKIRPLVIGNDRTSSLVSDALEFALSKTHIMTPTRDRLLQTLHALLLQGIEQAIEYDENHPDFPMTGDHAEKFSKRWVLHSLLWSFAGSAAWTVRNAFCEMLLRTSGVILPSNGGNETLADYRVRVDNGEYELWSDSVPRMEIESHRVSATDVVITTTDTVRHSDVLGAWLSSRRPLVLCGPPGSGKTMTLTAVLQSMQNVILASLNFSSRTTPEIILKTFSQYCVYVRRGRDIVLEPVEALGSQSWLVVFCDEINLPEQDTYGTQRVIMFMRQLVEQGGFWREDNTWVKINRIQFVGACNPPTDAGRSPMSHRFLRHVPLLLIDFPAKESLLQIYRTFNGGMMKLFPSLKGETEALTEAMVEVYLQNQQKFTPDMEPQYFYSPRELSRWVRGIYEAVVHMDQGLTREEFVRIWAHEALRLFSDRLVLEADREWCSNKIDEVARTHFAGVDFDVALARPLFYSSWMSKETKKVERDELRNFLSARLKVFYEEELDVPLVVFDEVLEHILRIDRVLRQPMGHLLLVGDSGAGKTVLSKFVSWMNGLNIFQIKAHSRYSLDDFNEDLRTLMRRVGVDGEKVCFIFDEGNVLGSGFLEAMNALLASGEVPGLFEGDELTALMNACRDSAARDGVILDSEEELFRRFTSIVQRNLHVVFTMNPSGGEWKNRSTTSPALFNRCVVDWFGTWSGKAMGEVGKEFTLKLDVGDAEAVGGSWGIGQGESLMDRVAVAFEGAATGGLRQAIVAALVDLQQITKDMADEVGCSESSVCRTYLSPRDYLALIQNFVSCLSKRRETVEDEQLHINAGLEKLRQTQDNVSELKAGLGAKTFELKEKDTLANKKLQQMVADQNEAEKRKEEAQKISIEVEKQEIEINARREEAQNDLDMAEPALLSAQTSVRGIKKRDLDEIRNLGRPPVNVKLTLECVAIMMGETSQEWQDVRKMLSKSDFIPNILNFDADKLTSKQIKLVQEKYLDGNPELTTESVTRSSKACGPLYNWAESQIKYSSVYNRVQPLRQEVEQLEKDSQVVKDQKDRMESEVATLEASIKQYKTDYASLIRDVETLKAEMETVTKKVDRAESLLKSLSNESQRWSKSSEGFQSILRSLIGDSLLMAAFLTYAGFFDFKTRKALLTRWRNTLDVLGIDVREDLSMLESLSKASERLEWQSQGLLGDQLSLENGAILNHSVRFPLVIDPSGQAIDFLMKRRQNERIQKTSFLDNSFMKTLAGAVRFGTTLLVENVEAIDPVLNPVLNREIQRTGGRSLVRIGTEDVDYSPKFSIILTTKNPAVYLTPDLCSRVTLVNFTVTPASLQSQSLSRIVKAEKPELESQRANLLKLQGEQNVKLRELEDQMLASISAVEGSILDDDRVVDGMEVLMKEGAQVEEQISKSTEVMAQVQTAVGKFEPIANVCRDLFVLLEAMREISFLYEFSSNAFMSMLEYVLNSPVKEGQTDEERSNAIKVQLFSELAARVGRGLQVEDKMVFALLLARLFTGKDDIGAEKADSTMEIVDTITQIFGPEFPWSGRGLNSLKSIQSNEITSSVPMMLCGAPGHDVSGRVESMARELNKELASVAMGSPEGYEAAEKYVASASKRGTWVMLKNCHLCTDWLRETLVKKLQSLGAGTHPDFRVFITSEIHPKLPTALLRISDIIVAEAPTGVKASLSRFLSSISTERLQNPVRNRLYLILAWVHSVVQERLRYIPIGWSESYEWTEADALHALDVIDALIDSAPGGRQQLDPEKLPWDAIRSTLCTGVFGGRITVDTDQSILDNLVEQVFTTECFDVNFKLVNVEGSPTLPDGSSPDDIFAWIETLPDHTPPTWIGLDSEAEAVRELKLAESVTKKVRTVGALLSQ